MSQRMSAYQKITPRIIVQLAAPHSWAPASIIPVLFATVLALGQHSTFSPLMFYALLAAAVLMHSAANTLNDYYDFIRGTDTLENSPENDDAILVYNNYNPATVRLIGLSFLLAALVLGFYIVLRTNYIPLIIGCIGVATVIAYSAGPQPLSYMPLGEFTSGVVMGLLLPLAVYSALTGQVHGLLLLYFLPLMMGIAMIMLTNNCCDIERDHAAGRKTLPILLGRPAARILHHLLLLAWILLITAILLGSFRGGLFIFPLMLLFASHSLKNLFTATLYPANRGYHMLDIYKGNLWINGAYIICVLVAACAKYPANSFAPAP